MNLLLILALQFFWPTLAKDREPDTLMAGAWVSCPEDDGEYAERAQVFSFKGRPLFEFHLGPRDEFAIFPGEIDGHTDHADPRNILGPAYHYDDLKTVAGGRTWSSAQLGVRLNVIAMPPTRPECYAYQVLLEHTTPTLAHR